MIGFIVIITSGIMGIVWDGMGIVKHPCLFWLLGMISGIVAGAFMAQAVLLEGF